MNEWMLNGVSESYHSFELYRFMPFLQFICIQKTEFRTVVRETEMGERRDQGDHPPAVSLWFSSLNGHYGSCHGGLLHSALSLESSACPLPCCLFRQRGDDSPLKPLAPEDCMIPWNPTHPFAKSPWVNSPQLFCLSKQGVANLPYNQIKY